MPPEIRNHPEERTTSINVDRTDWLKAAAIVFVSIDHFGYFFMEDDLWWAAVGRLAAPAFFFLMGYAKTRTVPYRWIWLGAGLTLLDSWNAGWSWVAPNILLSFVLIRLARPHLKSLLEDHAWVAFTIFATVFVLVVPLTGDIVDYGAEGWLWALFGLCQRLYVAGGSATDVNGVSPSSVSTPRPLKTDWGLMRLLACLVAAVVYIWQEQIEFSFSQIQLAVVVLGVSILALTLCRFQRGASRIQPRGAGAAFLHFVGRHTLEIYAIQLAGSELLIKLVPGLDPGWCDECRVQICTLVEYLPSLME